MYFVSRLELGKTLGTRVLAVRGQEPVVLCLKESALSAAIGLAIQVRGWIYPLLTEPLVIPADDRVIGVLNQDGQLCYNPGLSHYDIEDLEMNNQSLIQEASREAYSRLNKRLSDYGPLNKEALRGRTILLMGDVVRDQLQIGAAQEFLKSVATGPIISLVGNITPDSSTVLYQESQDSTFLDVMPFLFDDSHYFEQPDGYSVEEQRRLAMNIAEYWT